MGSKFVVSGGHFLAYFVGVQFDHLVVSTCSRAAAKSKLSPSGVDLVSFDSVAVAVEFDGIEELSSVAKLSCFLAELASSLWKSLVKSSSAWMSVRA